MKLADIQSLIRRRRLHVSVHALSEASKDDVRARDIVHAILNGEIIESYPERERVLILGPMASASLPLHVVCDYSDSTEIVAVTVYIPDRSEWIADRIRKR